MILAKLPSAADPRDSGTAVIPTGLQLAGTVMQHAVARRQRLANPPVSRVEFPAELNPSASPFPYYVDAAVIRGIRAMVRKNGPFVR